MNIFEKATKTALRFDSVNGNLSAEDLWHIPLGMLDGMAVAYKHELDNENVDSFIKPVPEKSTKLQLQFDVAKHIIEARMKDAETRKNAADKKALREKIMETIANKQDSELQEKSLEDLQKMLEEAE